MACQTDLYKPIEVNAFKFKLAWTISQFLDRMCDNIQSDQIVCTAKTGFAGCSWTIGIIPCELGTASVSVVTVSNPNDLRFETIVYLYHGKKKQTDRIEIYEQGQRHKSLTFVKYFHEVTEHGFAKRFIKLDGSLTLGICFKLKLQLADYRLTHFDDQVANEGFTVGKWLSVDDAHSLVLVPDGTDGQLTLVWKLMDVTRARTGFELCPKIVLHMNKQLAWRLIFSTDGFASTGLIKLMFEQLLPCREVEGYLKLWPFHVSYQETKRKHVKAAHIHFKLDDQVNSFSTTFRVNLLDKRIQVFKCLKIDMLLVITKFDKKKTD